MKESKQSKYSGVLKTLGPGILLAGAAIGGSHLVQSTRAGAMYGFALIWVIILVNLFKYPFFEFVYRYSSATGESMMEGYKRAGSGMLLSVVIIVFISGILNITALVVVTAGLAGKLFTSRFTMFQWACVVSAICMGLLLLGKYRILDLAMKIIVGVLAITTVIAFCIALAHGSTAKPEFLAPSVWTVSGIAFLLALMGWMPTPVDVAIWPSLWAQEKQRLTGYTPTFKESLIDFHLGYIGTAILALAFLGLGALVMFGTGEKFSPSGIAFAGQFIQLYTCTLGNWTFYLVATAALTCIFSSTLACFDGYPLTLQRGVNLLINRKDTHHRSDPIYWGNMLFFTVTALVIIKFFITSMIQIITIATIIAFLTAPIVAYFNFRVIKHSDIPKDFQPPKWLLGLCYLGLVYLTGFSIIYIVSLFC